ncbi:MAG: hypothetical protein GY775_06330 [Candidatus Scalindua sp.]|nr:hypothetical protein [Candidatus Scalindua sp.]
MSDLERSTQNIGNTMGAGLAYGYSTLSPGLRLLSIPLVIILALLTNGSRLNHFEAFGVLGVTLMLVKTAPQLLISILILTGIVWVSIFWSWSSWVELPIVFLVILTFTRLFIQGAQIDSKTRECIRAQDIGETVSGVFAVSLIALLVSEYFDYSIFGLTMNWQQWGLFLLTSGCAVYLAEEKSKKVMNSAAHNFLSFLLSLSFMYWLYSVVPTIFRSYFNAPMF